MFRVKSTRRNVKRVAEPAVPLSAVPLSAVPLSAVPLPAPVTLPAPLTLPAVSAVPLPATLPAPVTLSVPVPSEPSTRPAASSTSNTVEFFAAESAATALTKPWLRLERGLRLQRFRAYAEAYPGLSVAEKARLYEVLVIANDKKLLNTKQHVTYENGVILSVRGLKIIHTGEPQEPAVIKIEPLRFTKRNTEDV